MFSCRSCHCAVESQDGDGGTALHVSLLVEDSEDEMWNCSIACRRYSYEEEVFRRILSDG